MGLLGNVHFACPMDPHNGDSQGFQVPKFLKYFAEPPNIQEK